MTARAIATDPDRGIPDLIRRLTGDSKRLVTDEVQLAKLEAQESMRTATRGALWMVLAFGAAVVMLVSLTIFAVTLIGRLVGGHIWLGALVMGIVELAAGALLLKRGLASYARPSYSLVETRRSLGDTVDWVATARH